MINRTAASLLNGRLAGSPAVRWAVEFKLTTSPRPSDMEKLDAAAHLIGASRRYLVSRSSRILEGPGRISCNLATLVEHVQNKRRPQ